jgi:spore maturation protein CgeB
VVESGEISRIMNGVFPSQANKKGLCFFSGSVNSVDYFEGWRKAGFECEILNLATLQNSEALTDNVKLGRIIAKGGYRFVFSINYFAILAEACFAAGIPYIACSIDSPVPMEKQETLKYNTTTLFLFDSAEVYLYNKLGYVNVHYMPLASPVDRYDSIKPTAEDWEKYGSQVSFVGNLYEHKLYEYIGYLSDYKKGFFNAIIDYNVGRYDSYGFEDVLNLDLSRWMNEPKFIDAVFEGESVPGLNDVTVIESKEITDIIDRVRYLTGKAITNRERIILITMLSRHWKFKLYSPSSNELFSDVIEMGTVDYYEEMPGVFKCTEINLNNTLKSIKSGIPLRCLDVMGCGGFLLTNYQRDLDEYYKDGENIAIYRSLDEAFEKCDFYLKHENSRMRIANLGYETVRKYYSYDVIISEIIRIARI